MNHDRLGLIAVSHHSARVTLQWELPANQINMQPTEAVQFAMDIMHHAREAMKQAFMVKVTRYEHHLFTYSEWQTPNEARDAEATPPPDDESPAPC